MIGAMRDVTKEHEARLALREASEELTRSERALRRQATILDERNTALRVLLEQREQDRRELEQRVVAQRRAAYRAHARPPEPRAAPPGGAPRARGGAGEPARDRRPVRSAASPARTARGRRSPGARPRWPTSCASARPAPRSPRRSTSRRRRSRSTAPTSGASSACPSAGPGSRPISRRWLATSRGREQGRGVRATLAAATAVLLTVCVASACGGGVAASAPTASSAPASPAASVTPGATKSAGAVTAMSRFRLLALPASAEVAFLRDTVVWRVAPRDLSPTGPMPLIPVWRVDVTTGAMTRDAWLTSLLGGRRIDDWALARNKVAWVDSSARIELANGTVLVGAQVEVARRSSGTTQPLSRTSWGTLSKNGEYSPGAWLAGFDGRLCALRTRDLARASSGAATASGPRARTLAGRHHPELAPSARPRRVERRGGPGDDRQHGLLG